MIMIVLRLLSPFPTLPRWSSVYHFFLVKRGELERLSEMYLICCWRLIEHYTAQAHYGHDIALVDQGGNRCNTPSRESVQYMIM